MCHLLEKSNITLLNDEYVTIDNRLLLIGRVDPSPMGGFGSLQRREITDILTTIDTTLSIVVMYHTPSHLEQYGKEVDVIVSGHTHKGQMFPFSLVTNMAFTSDYGHY